MKPLFIALRMAFWLGIVLWALAVIGLRHL